MKKILIRRKKGEPYHCPNQCGATYTHDQARDHVLNKCQKRKQPVEV
jgi:hypothetical protein